MEIRFQVKIINENNYFVKDLKRKKDRDKFSIKGKLEEKEVGYLVSFRIVEHNFFTTQFN